MLKEIKFLGIEEHEADEHLPAYKSYRFSFTYRGREFEGGLSTYEDNSIFEKSFFIFTSKDALRAFKSNYEKEMTAELLEVLKDSLEVEKTNEKEEKQVKQSEDHQEEKLSEIKGEQKMLDYENLFKKMNEKDPMPFEVTESKAELIQAFCNYYEVKNNREMFFNPLDVTVSVFFREKGYFALITKPFIKALANFIGDSKVLEVFAGSGLLTSQLKDAGVDIRATDNFSWNIETDNVENIDAVEAVKKYSDVDYILMSWQPYDKSHDYEMVQALKKYNPEARIINITEGYGGCIGSTAFYEAVEAVENDKFYDVTSSYERWKGVHDYPYLFKIK